MLFVYPAIFHHDKDSYWVEFPDLDGCLSDGISQTEAFSNAQDALSGYLLSLIDRNLTIPDASKIEEHSTDDGFISLVSVSIDPYKDTKAVKKTLSIPSWMNDRAVAMGINFSQTLQEALLQKFS